MMMLLLCVVVVAVDDDDDVVVVVQVLSTSHLALKGRYTLGCRPFPTNI